MISLGIFAYRAPRFIQCAALRMHYKSYSALPCKKNPGALGEPMERLAVILDMDECLIHSQFLNEEGEVDCIWNGYIYILCVFGLSTSFYFQEFYRQVENRKLSKSAYEDRFSFQMHDGVSAITNKRPGDTMLLGSLFHTVLCLFSKLQWMRCFFRSWCVFGSSLFSLWHLRLYRWHANLCRSSFGHFRQKADVKRWPFTNFALTLLQYNVSGCVYIWSCDSVIT